MADNPHTGHRRRMLDKFEQFGLRVLNDHEVLEMLLYFSVRQGDTNPAAHALMRRFGDLHAVFEAPREQLEQSAGSRRVRGRDPRAQPSEPILFPKLRIRFADFPCLHCSIDQRLFTLET